MRLFVAGRVKGFSRFSMSNSQNKFILTFDIIMHWYLYTVSVFSRFFNELAFQGSDMT